MDLTELQRQYKAKKEELQNIKNNPTRASTRSGKRLISSLEIDVTHLYLMMLPDEERREII